MDNSMQLADNCKLRMDLSDYTLLTEIDNLEIATE